MVYVQFACISPVFLRMDSVQEWLGWSNTINCMDLVKLYYIHYIYDDNIIPHPFCTDLNSSLAQYSHTIVCRLGLTLCAACVHNIHIMTHSGWPSQSWWPCNCRNNGCTQLKASMRALPSSMKELKMLKALGLEDCIQCHPSRSASWVDWAADFPRM